MRNEHEIDLLDDDASEDLSPTLGSPFRYSRNTDPPSTNSTAGLFGRPRRNGRIAWPPLPVPQEDVASEPGFSPVLTRVNGQFMPLSWQSLANAVYGNAPGLN